MVDRVTPLVFKDVVKNVEKRQRTVRAYKIGNDDSHVEHEDLGWFVLLLKLRVALNVGPVAPDLQPGDSVEIVLRKP